MRRKALILGIAGSGKSHRQRTKPQATSTRKEGHTKGVHSDAIDMRQALIDLYSYDEKDITMLIDDNSHSIQPTKKTVLREMEKLVAHARPGDRLYLHYSGHGEQLPDDNDDEEDGWDECIVTCDNKKIRDDKLKKIMVDRLPAGCNFFSVFDSCNSGTVLDLTHYRCNRVYVPWVSKTIPRAISPDAEHHHGLGHHSFAHPTTLSAHEVARVDVPAAHEPHPDHPDHPFCKGMCRDDPHFNHDTSPVANVISLSAAKDYQLSWAGRSGTSLTQALIQVLRANPNPTLEFLLKSVSHKIHDSYLGLHHDSHLYEEWLKRENRRRQKRGKRPNPGKKVESENFQDPQISSHRPLDDRKTMWEL